MSEFQWHFRTQRKGDRDRNPIQNEFFASEAVGSVVSALVREGLQNSGDARSLSTPEGDPVRVRIFASEKDGSLPAQSAAVWGKGLWDHVSAADSGLRTPPEVSDNCRYLVFEDFGTTGLTGDTTSDDVHNDPFYCFFRAENTSSKSSGAGGSWGVGKTAFPRSSQSNGFFALSVREDDSRSVLMGSLTLRTRHVNGVKYTPDSWFGRPEPGEPDGGAIQPIEDPELIGRFSRDFNLERTTQTGTSIVVPWCDESLSRDALLWAVIETNFLPIIAGDLVVTVASPHGELVLDSGSIEEELRNLNPDNLDSLLSGVQLAKWARTQSPSECVSPKYEPAAHSVKWDQYSLTESDRTRLRARFDESQPVAFRVPVPVKWKSGTTHTSHLDVFLQRTSDGATVNPVFVRGSVVVPDHKIQRVPGAVAIIRSSDDELGNLLRAAEDPGHKEWSTETDNFAEMKANVKYARSYLTLARQAAIKCSRLLQEPDAEMDLELLGDVFSLPCEPEDEPRRPGGGGRRTKPAQPPVVPVKPPAQRLKIDRIAGGFRVTRAAQDSPLPEKIRVRAAYDVRRKNPFNQWDPEDFEFGKPPISIECDGLEIELCEGNRLAVTVNSPDFALTVTGFDAERGDLILKVIPEGLRND